MYFYARKLTDNISDIEEFINWAINFKDTSIDIII